MSQAAIPRSLLPRRLNNHIIVPHWTITGSLSSARHASSHQPPPSKPRTLEKPSKFNPPSHGARLNRPPPRNYPGPALSSEAKQERATKQYPHMMPPEGSFMYWFLTNRGIHMWITLSTLTSLAIYTFLTNFRLTSPFAHLLPPFSSFLSHPISFMSTWLEVYKLHTAHISAETAERRKRKVDDVVKRSEYRKAHGLDQGEGFGAWTARTEGEALGPAIGGSEVKGVNVVAMGDGTVGNGAEKEEKGVYKDFEGRRRPVKKWFGIW